jgi:hypothetical protein
VLNDSFSQKNFIVNTNEFIRLRKSCDQDFDELIHDVRGTYIYENDFINLKKPLDDFQVELKKLIENLNGTLH